MDGAPKNSKKDRLLTVLGDAQSANAKLREKAQNLAESAGFAEGLARHLRPVIEQMAGDSALPNDLWRDLTGAWEAQNRFATSKYSVVTSAPSSSATTAAATLTTTGSTQMLSGWVRQSDELDALRSYVRRPTRIEKVRGLVCSFGLDRASSGSRSALELLNEASGALARPPGASPAPTAVLVTAREAVQTALADLLRRRPTQEPAGKPNRKVVSIGQQCGLSHLDGAHFERMGRDLGRLLDRLSGAKSGALTRPQVTDLFDEVLQFFEAFLESLDRSALK